MGAVGLVTPWTTKDDLLLKKALENGASLESLAKGAVQFSRRYTIMELQDRWHSLLYDVNTSIEASVRMIEFERLALKHKTKSKRACDSKSKENDCGRGKRKAGSVRSYYYSLRKRMCREPLNPCNLNFLGGSYNINGSEAPGVNTMLLDQVADHFGLEDTSLHDFTVFPQVTRNKALPCGVSGFPSEQPSRLGESIEKNSVQKEVPLGNSIAMTGNCTRLGQMDPSKELPKSHYIFQATESSLASNGKDTTSPSYGRNTVLISPLPDCQTSFNPMQDMSTPPAMPNWGEIDCVSVQGLPDDVNHMQDMSTLPAMPDWEEIEGVSVQGLPDDVNIKGNNVLTGEPFNIADGGGAGKGISEGNVINMDHNHMSCDKVNNVTDCTDGYFVELIDTLFDFTNEEILENAIDKSYLDGLSSILLNSPYDADDEMPKVPETAEPAVPVAYPDIVSIDPEEKIGVADSHWGVRECTLESQIPTSASDVNPQLPEYYNGVICCTLNTEDSEIPCNDHIVFPRRTASALRRTQNEANYPLLPVKDGNGNPASEKGVSTMKRAQPKRSGEYNPASQMQGPEQLTHNDVIDKSCHVSGSGHLQSDVGGINQEGQAPPVIRGLGCYAADLTTTEPGGEPLSSDQSDEQFSESDTDIPCFSDIEAMILGMDLGPDEDSFSSREVPKHEDEGPKRAIIRLEQHAHSHMQRVITKHGALAILCGRRSTHYIKKAEVLLGRRTDGVAVDIDLGMEGRANMISRRQAIIKMYEDGTFYMKNLGKLPIYVDEHQISKGKCLCLHSYCLIQIRGMSFMFVTGEVCLKQYLNNGARKS